jgi:hypothetical protein
MCRNTEKIAEFFGFQNFFRAFFKVGINEFGMSILHFLYPCRNFFANSECKCKKCTYSNILLRVQRYFFANIYHSPLDSHKFEVLKPPILRHRVPTVRHDRTRVCVRVSNLEIQMLCARCCYMGHSRVDESRKFCSFRSSYLWDTSEELLQLGAGIFFIFFVSAPSSLPTSGIPVRNCCS